MKRKIDKLKQIASNFEVHTFYGIKHVLSAHVDRNNAYPDPNFKGTSKALIGILYNQTFEQFCDSWINRKIKAV